LNDAVLPVFVEPDDDGWVDDDDDDVPVLTGEDKPVEPKRRPAGKPPLK